MALPAGMRGVVGVFLCSTPSLGVASRYVEMKARLLPCNQQSYMTIASFYTPH